MSSEDLGKMTSHGLMSIDLATSVIIKNLMVDKDYPTTHENLETYCNTLGDKEIIEVCMKHQKETTHHLQVMRCEQPYTPQDRMSKIGEQQNYLGQRCHELWKIIRLLMKEKQYIDWGGVRARNPVRGKLGGETNEP